MKKPSAVDHVVDAIIDEIISGKIRPGERLSTEPELSKKYGVGRNSAREAIKQLQAFGILYIKRADGTFVSDTYNDRMLDPLLYNLIFSSSNWKDFVQLRYVIDVGTLHLALQDPGSARIVPKLTDIVDNMDAEMKTKNPDADRILELDLSFHTTILNIIHNPLVDCVAGYITRLTVSSRKRAVTEWINSGRKSEFCSLHRKLTDLIRDRKTENINEVVKEHYKLWK
ncbi:MAG: FadR family transcriptional regulator [Clostridiales bacterium]|nr:FadR family transcriptional regulator [Clostridiales bacterium]